MKNRWGLPLFLLVVIAIIIMGFAADADEPKSEHTNQNQSAPEWTDEFEVTYSPDLVDDSRVYEKDRINQVDYLYLTILPVKPGAKDHTTWGDLNEKDYTWNATDTPRLNIVFQQGDADGPAAGEFGWGETTANATITIRGRSSRRAPQKSYKVRLYDNAGYWNNQKVINLSKSPYDLTRIRHKLSFDYFQLMPDFASVRTRFTHVFVKDLSSGQVNAEFVDYGLFTQLEQVNKLYLRSHGFDPYGHLYKANYFEFFRYEDNLRLKTDPLYDEALFESHLQIEGDDNHTKLLTMLDDVNDLTKDFQAVFDTYFDRDNFLTWTALNIIFDNADTTTQNYYLYSPLNSNKWFFLPWDYDKGWGGTLLDDFETERGPMWQRGLSNYWGMVIHRRFFKIPGAIELLNEKIDSIMTIVTEGQTRAFIDSYREVIDPIILSEPDIAYLPGTVEEYKSWMEHLPLEPQRQLQEYYEYLERPLPIFLGEVVQSNAQLQFQWDHSYDFQGDPLTYELFIAEDYTFDTIIKHEDNLQVSSLTMDVLPPGTYYWRVMVRDVHGNMMEPFDYYIDPVNGNTYKGMKQFEVTP